MNCEDIINGMFRPVIGFFLGMVLATRDLGSAVILGAAAFLIFFLAGARARDLGLTLRKWPATRHVPLVFAGGEAAKVARVRALLPDNGQTGCSALVWQALQKS